MELTEKQKTGLNIALQRYKAGEKCTVISGYAGTGKSTTVKFIVSALKQENEELTDEDFCFCAYTGKATAVLQSKGNKNCLTLHKLLYKNEPLPDGTFIRLLKEQLSYKIIIVDEVSMAPMSLMKDLFSFEGIYVLCLR